MSIKQIHQNNSDYPSILKKYLDENSPKVIACIGNLDILKKKTLAVFCSVKCPGNLILQTYDLAQHLRDDGVTVISGFHSPIERECLNILLRGKQSVIICPARSIEGMRIKKEFRKPIEDGRLLLLSHFTDKQNRISSQRALERNRFVAAITDSIFVSYAAKESKTEGFCREILKWQKPLYTFESDVNANLIALGAKPLNHLKLSE